VRDLFAAWFRRVTISFGVHDILPQRTDQAPMPMTTAERANTGRWQNYIGIKWGRGYVLRELTEIEELIPRASTSACALAPKDGSEH
jgi:hypothetical protein